MIYFVDKAVSKDIHVVFNSSVLKMIRLIYPEESIKFCSEEIHGKLVSEMLNDHSDLITYSHIQIKNSHSTGLRKVFQWFSKTIIDFFFFIKLFNDLKKDKGNRVILNIPPISFMYFKLIKLFYPKQIVYLLLHGELEYLYYNNNFREKMIGFFYRMMFVLKGNNVKYVVFNKVAKNYLIRDKYIKANQIIEIEHPYIYTDDVVINSLLNESSLVVANIGSLMIRKRGEKIFELANLLYSEILNKELSVRTIGKVDIDLLPYDNKLIGGIQSSSHSLTRTDFEQQVKQIHYSLFFFDETHFVFRASGALMDAINFAKPIIAIKHPLFSSIFDQYGAIGYLCNDINEMVALIQAIKNDRVRFEAEYLVIVNNIKKLKKELSIESIALDFKNQDKQFM